MTADEILRDPSDIKIMDGMALMRNGDLSMEPMEPMEPMGPMPSYENEQFTAPPFSIIDCSEPGVRLAFGPMVFTAAKALELFTNAGIAAENVLPPLDEEIFGYKRGTSEGIIPDALPVLAGIGEIQALPDIKDPALARVFAEAEKQGPRLVAAIHKGAGIPIAARIVIAEFPPATVLARAEDTYFQIRTPFVVASFSPGYGNLFLRCRTAPLTQDDQQLYILPFPHIDNTGGVCLGPLPRPMKELQDAEPLEAITAMMNAYWENGYRYYLGAQQIGQVMGAVKMGHTGHNAAAYTDMNADLKAWEKLSFDEVLTMPYTKAETLEDFIKARTGRGNGGRWPVRFFLNDDQIQRADAAVALDYAQGAPNP